jgi:hypothetical protein
MKHTTLQHNKLLYPLLNNLVKKDAREKEKWEDRKNEMDRRGGIINADRPS